MRDFFNRARNRWAFLRRSGPGQQNRKLAVFVHGFRGKYLDTWGKLPDFLREHADDGAPFAEWDYLFLGYSTWHVETYLDIAALVRTHVALARKGTAPFDHSYDSFAFFGHSLGTLGLRQLLCAHTMSHDFRPAIHSVTLFAPPINGSFWARFAPSRIAEALKPGCPQLRMLKEWTDGAYQVAPWPSPRVVIGLNDMVVGEKSAWFVKWTGDQECEYFHAGHFDMKEPDAWTDPSVRMFFGEALK